MTWNENPDQFLKRLIILKNIFTKFKRVKKLKYTQYHENM